MRLSSADLERRQEAERRVRRLSEAWVRLLDEEKRRRYDRELAAAGSEGEPAAARERGRFETLPEPVPPTEWVEEMLADARYESPESRLGSPYGI